MQGKRFGTRRPAVQIRSARHLLIRINHSVSRGRFASSAQPDIFSQSQLISMYARRGAHVAYRRQSDPKSFICDLAGDLSAASNASGTLTYTYDVAGREVSRILPDGITTTDGYDAAGELVGTRNSSGNSYSWGDSGNLLSSQAYVYNAAVLQPHGNQQSRFVITNRSSPYCTAWQTAEFRR